MDGTTLFGLCVAAFGLVVLVLGKVAFGPEGGDDSDDVWLHGAPARWVGAVLLLAGLVVLVNAVAGFSLVLGAIALAWWLTR